MNNSSFAKNFYELNFSGEEVIISIIDFYKLVLYDFRRFHEIFSQIRGLVLF